jgi:hypothetical protein
MKFEGRKRSFLSLNPVKEDKCGAVHETEYTAGEEILPATTQRKHEDQS